MNKIEDYFKVDPDSIPKGVLMERNGLTPFAATYSMKINIPSNLMAHVTCNYPVNTLFGTSTSSSRPTITISPAIQFTCKAGYRFKSAPSWAWYSSSTTPMENVKFNLSSDKKSWTCDTTRFTYQYMSNLIMDIYSMPVEEDDVKTTVQQTLSHCTSSVTNGTQFDANSTQQITLTADDGYEFTTTPTSSIGTVTVDTNKKTCLIEATMPATSGTWSISATATEQVKPKVLTNLTNCTATITPSDYDVGTEVTVVISMNENCRNLQITSNYGTITDNTVTAILTTDDLVITATAEQIPVYTLTQDLTNCQSDTTTSQYLEGTEVTVTLTANVGYRFDNDPVSSIADATIVNNTDTVTLTVVMNTDWTITAVATAIPRQCTFNYKWGSLPHATCNIEDDTVINVGTIRDIIVTPESGYSLTSVRIEAPSSLPETIPIQEDGNAVYNSYYFDREGTYNLVVQTEKDEKIVNFNYDEVVNCTVNPQPQSVNVNEQSTLVLTFTANEGFYFNDKPYASWEPSGQTFSDNEYRITLDMTHITVGSTVTVHAVAVPVERATSLITMYKPTDRDLVRLSATRFKQESGSVTNYMTDLGQYILSLRQFQVPIPQSVEESIVLGYTDTGVITPTVDTPVINVDMGSIQVEGVHNNSLDYKYGKMEAELPFVGVVSVDLTKVMNKTVGLRYTVNVYQGQALCELYDFDVPSTILGQWNAVVAMDIPYILQRPENGPQFNMIANGELDANSKVFFKPVPQLVLRVNDVIENPQPFGNTTVVYDQLSNHTGHVTVSELEMSAFTGTNPEKDEILALCKTGILV